MSDFKLTAMNDLEREFVDWLVFEEGVPLEAMDTDPHGQKEEVSFEETAAYAIKNMDMKVYLPLLERVNPNFKNPLDTRNFNPLIKERIAEFRKIALAHAKSLGLPPDDPNFCEKYFEKFFKLGANSFQNGGLCLQPQFSDESGYSYDTYNASPDENMRELTSQEFFDHCLEPTTPGTHMGSCTENTYARIASASIPGLCELEPTDTEHHLYPAYYRGKGSKDGRFDGSEIGEIGWRQKAAAEAAYLTNFYNEATLQRIGFILAPETKLDYVKINALFDEALDYLGIKYLKQINFLECTPSVKRDRTLGMKRLGEMLRMFDPVVRSNTKMIRPFVKLGNLAQRLMIDKGVAYGFGMAIIRRWPENPYSIIPLASTLNWRDKWDVSNVAKTLRDKFPGTGWGETVQGMMDSQHGRVKEAISNFEKAAAKNPKNPYSLQYLSQINLQLGDQQMARNMAQQAMDAAPNLVGIHSTLADIALNSGDIDTAYVEAKKEATVQIGNLNASLLYATLANAKGKPAEARKILEQILITNIRRGASDVEPSIITPLISSHLLMGHVDEAMGVFRSTQRMPGTQAAMIAFNGMQIASSDFNIEEVEWYMRKIPSIYKTFGALTLTKAGIHIAKGKLAEASRLLISIPADTKDPAFLNTRASYEYIIGDIESARATLEQVVSKNGYDVFAQATLVDCDLAGNDLEAARARFDELIEEFPDVMHIRAIEPRVLYAEERYEEAIASAEEILKVHKRNLPTISASAWAHLKIGEFQKAAALANEIKSINRYIPDSDSVLALAYMGMGRFSEAKKHALAAKEKVNGFPVAILSDDNPENILAEIEKREKAGK